MVKFSVLKESKAFFITLSALLMLAATIKVCGCSSDMDECPSEESSECESEESSAE